MKFRCQGCGGWVDAGPNPTTGQQGVLRTGEARGRPKPKEPVICPNCKRDYS